MEKTFYKEVKKLELRPAVYNGKELDRVPVHIKGCLIRVWIDEAKVIKMKPGDTVRATAKVIDNENDKVVFFDLYLSGAVLDSFIEKYGDENINATVYMKLKFFYFTKESLVEPDEDCEYMGYEVLEIYPEEE